MKKDEKIKLVEEYLNGDTTIEELCLKGNTSKSTLSKWITEYNKIGEIADKKLGRPEVDKGMIIERHSDCPCGKKECQDHYCKSACNEYIRWHKKLRANKQSEFKTLVGKALY